jgi:hypothetical protein
VPIEDWGYPEFPDCLDYLWDWFISLNNTRQVSMGVSPISEQEIHAFCVNRSMRMAVFEVEAIRQLDRVALTEINKD